MPNLSTYSDDDLIRIAGLQSATKSSPENLSSYSDEQLMKMAGVVSRPLHPMETGPYNPPEPTLQDIISGKTGMIPAQQDIGLRNGKFVPKPPRMIKEDIAATERMKAGRIPMEGVEANPWVDPLTVAEVGLTMGAGGAIKTGLTMGTKEGIKQFGRSAVGTGVSAVADIPLGTATEYVAKDYPYLAYPFSILMGTFSNVIPEKIITGKILQAFSRKGIKPAQEMIDIIAKQVKSNIDAGQPDEADKIISNIQGQIEKQHGLKKWAEPVKSARESAEVLKQKYPSLPEYRPSTAKEAAQT